MKINEEQRLRIRNSGFSLIEAVVATVILSIFIMAALNIFNETTKNGRNDHSQSQAIEASRNVTSIIESIAMYDPTTLQQMPAGATFPVNAGTGSGPKTATNASQIVQLTLENPGSPGPGGNLEYTFDYVTSDNHKGVVVVPIHRMATPTTGCDPTNNITENCSNYIVPGK